MNSKVSASHHNPHSENFQSPPLPKGFAQSHHIRVIIGLVFPYRLDLIPAIGFYKIKMSALALSTAYGNNNRQVLLFGAAMNRTFNMIKGNAKNNPTTGRTILAKTTKNKTNGRNIYPSVLRVIFSAAHFNLLMESPFRRTKTVYVKLCSPQYAH